MKHECPICSKSYCWPSDLKRHMRNVHIEQQQKQQQQQQQSFVFRTPFTMQISAPSMGGKTTWLNLLLTQMEDYMYPVPQRIVYCYSQKQPAYEEIKEILPNTVEFVRGIPDDIEEDYYFDPKINNMIILDDVMMEAKNDNRISNLFTRGSHHRNLSVVYLTQNLFPQGKASRDIALNCHYLVLFNNPVDRQQISLLAKRIQPSTTESFMKVYEAAVYKPYGNLLIDLKANTPERERLKANVLEQQDHENPTLEMPILEREMSTETQQDSTDEMPVLEREASPAERQVGGALYTTFPPPWYKQQEGRGIKRGQEPEEISDHRIWKKLFMPKVIEKIKDKIDHRIEQYLEKGEDETKANILAYNENLPKMRKLLMQQFVDYILNKNALEKDSFYRLILDTAQRMSLEYRMGEKETWKKAAEMRIYLIDDILPYKEDESEVHTV